MGRTGMGVEMSWTALTMQLDRWFRNISVESIVYFISGVKE